MKLSLINEAYEHFTFFRGVASLEAVHQALNSDTELKKVYWTRSVSIALLYSIGSPHVTDRENDGVAYVLEAKLNIRNNDSSADEDSLAIGEAPYNKEYGLEWVDWFQRFFPKLPEKFREQFVNEYNEHNYVDTKWSKFVPVNRDAIRSTDTRGTHRNIVTSKVGRKGSNKIVGSYIFTQNPGNPIEFIVQKKIGNGSLSIGDSFTIAREFSQ